MALESGLSQPLLVPWQALDYGVATMRRYVLGPAEQLSSGPTEGMFADSSKLTAAPDLEKRSGIGQIDDSKTLADWD